MTGRVRKEELFATLPPAASETTASPEALRSARMLVVLDDDPTGTQTVHGIEVVTDWSPETLRGVMANRPSAFYLLTNTRSYPLAEAAAMNREIARNLAAVAGELDVDFDVVSRSDSTLRGHYPGETDALREALEAATGWRYDGDLLAPFFLEGGRFTVGGVHYVAEGEWLVPAAETEFARDTAFGFRSSSLPEWVEEKTGGRVKAAHVVAVSLGDLRVGGAGRVAERLTGLGPGKVGYVDLVDYSDVDILTAALLSPAVREKRFLYRTAASFVRVRAGIAPGPLLTAADFPSPANGARGGLVVVGSHIRKSSEQLEQLLQLENLLPVEVPVNRILEPGSRDVELARLAGVVARGLAEGRDVVVFTSRELIRKEGAEANLEIAQTVSAALVRLVRDLKETPRFVVAKGGITSSDVATKGLGIKRATVAGQLLPGVPVWRTGQETKFPGLHYVVFPGNVGDSQALRKAVEILRGRGTTTIRS